MSIGENEFSCMAENSALETKILLNAETSLKEKFHI